MIEITRKLPMGSFLVFGKLETEALNIRIKAPISYS
jgi:hypothetical protein